MHVVATAGHVDHGKSTLVRALTGTDPDRLEEEQRRGLSITLGYCWTDLPPVGDVAFVDVPGHERFVTTMLSGVGPVPAVLVVAADDPWMPQAAEHLAALDALGVAHGVLAVTRADLADPGPAASRAREELRRTSLGDVPVVPVSGRTGHGLDDLRAALVDMVHALPAADPAADVRIWVDRVFHVRGAGTVVTGTLQAGTVRVGDILSVDGNTLRVRGLECLGLPVGAASGVSRVAVNVGGRVPEALARGAALVSPDAWLAVPVVDVRLETRDVPPPASPLLHIGATAVGTHLRPLDDRLARLTLARPLPLRVGDRALLRDPGSRRVWGVRVVDPAPPPLRRRGAAALRAKELAAADGTARDEVARRGLVQRALLRLLGVDATVVPPGVVAAAGWLLSPERAADLRARLPESVRPRATALVGGVPVAAVARDLGLPSPDLVAALVEPPLRVSSGRVYDGRAGDLPTPLLEAVAALRQDLTEAPFAAPEAARLEALGLDARSLAALVRSGHLLRLSDTIVLLPGADAQAAAILAGLPQPFTASEARAALGSTRRVVLPLLSHLDRTGLTTRLPDDRRRTNPR